MLTPRKIFFLSLLASILALVAALYLQFGLDLSPCPLCILQRIALFLFVIVIVIAYLHNPAKLGIRVYAILAFLIAAGGLFFAGKQVWLQSLPPDQVPACGPGLNYMIKVLPLDQILLAMIKGTGDCAKIDWTFLHLSLAVWSAALFALLCLTMVYTFIRTKRL